MLKHNILYFSALYLTQPRLAARDVDWWSCWTAAWEESNTEKAVFWKEGTIFYTEDGDSKFLWNIGNSLQAYMTYLKSYIQMYIFHNKKMKLALL
jgi:hypothetical protein